MTDIFKLKEQNTPLVHCITNYVTVNDCANAILAFGGSPIMADDKNEVEDITSICNALVINIGTLNERTVAAMVKAGKRANQLNHPVVLDPVGAGASKMRTETASKLLREVQFQVIRGNISEIKTLYNSSGSTQGVDASEADQVTEGNLEKTVEMARNLSKQTGAVVAITGKTDIIADHASAYLINNGCGDMSRITGTGCMLSAIVGAAAALSGENLLETVAQTVSYMGICGELAKEKTESANGGTSTFRMYLIDYLSKLTKIEFTEREKIEQYQ